MCGYHSGWHYHPDCFNHSKCSYHPNVFTTRNVSILEAPFPMCLSKTFSDNHTAAILKNSRHFLNNSAASNLHNLHNPIKPHSSINFFPSGTPLLTVLIYWLSGKTIIQFWYSLIQRQNPRLYIYICIFQPLKVSGTPVHLLMKSSKTLILRGFLNTAKNH